MKHKSINFNSARSWIAGSSIILATGCTTTKHIEVCEPVDVSHVCPEDGHGPCPFCPVESEKTFTWYQAFDEKWKHDPGINPIFVTREEAEAYADSNNFSGDRKTGHKYIVREVDYRYVIRIMNLSTNELLYTTSEFNDAYEYVVEYSSAHSDLVIFDLHTGQQYEETP